MKRTEPAKALAMAVDAPPFTLSAKAVRLVAGIGINIGSNIGINDTQKQILLLVKENRAITAAQLAGRIGIAQRNIETNLAQLKKNGLHKICTMAS